jgi:predicted dehydrogenase
VTTAVIGAGYWGPNLIRNFLACSTTDLRWVCDLEPARARRILGDRTAVSVTDALDDVLDDAQVEAVAIATPAATHVELALACLEAGKHVLVEKPLATSVADAEKLVDVAARAGRVLMSDHTYCYTAAVQRIAQSVARGSLGELQYVDSVRINLGLVQPDIDVFWDLAPHDLSILDFVLPGGCEPVAVAAQCADPIGAGVACVGYLTLHLGGGAIAHIHVNWLSPTKIRTTIFGGSRQIAVWDDLNPTQRLSIYDKGVDLGDGTASRDAQREALVSYRIGDMVAPALREREALEGVAREFADAIREHRAPLTDGEAGLRVVRILEAVGRSIDAGGAAVPLSTDPAVSELVGVGSEAR